jgi:hypothetical protein
VTAHHEGLGDQLARAVARRYQLLGLLGVERDRLLAQHMLAGLGRLDRPRHVQVVGQRVVDRLDLAVGQQLFIRAVGLGMPSSLAHFLASARSREAMAWMRQCLLFCIAGMTLAVPIRAVLMMPQFTGCMALSPLFCS